jgi:hypothetical protein
MRRLAKAAPAQCSLFACWELAGGLRPAVWSELETVCPRDRESAPVNVPGQAIDSDVRPLDPNQIPRVQFSPAARGRCGSRLNKQRGVSRNPVPQGTRAGAACVKVPRENHVDPTTCKSRHRHVGATDEAVGALGVCHIERVMGDEDGRSSVGAPTT